MTTTTSEELRGWIGHDAVDAQGDKIGRIENLYVDDATGEPEWFSVSTGWFGTRVSFVPAAGATDDGDRLRVPYEKSFVKDAPNAEADGDLDPAEEDRLYSYYGIRGAADVARGGDRQRGYDTSGPTTDDAMTRSEEEVRVGTARHEAGRARLRKWVETEYVQQTVPVKKEKARVVTEPITDANVDRAMSGSELSSEEHEIVLSEEEPVVEKRVVPKERVRLEAETYTDEETVGTEVQKERIAAEGDIDDRREGRRAG